MASLWTAANSPQGVDQGSCLVYNKLSYRRKLIRTLWVVPFCVLLLMLPDFPNRGIWLSLTLITGVLQGVYNYQKWRKLEC